MLLQALANGLTLLAQSVEHWFQTGGSWVWAYMYLWSFPYSDTLYYFIFTYCLHIVSQLVFWSNISLMKNSLTSLIWTNNPFIPMESEDVYYMSWWWRQHYDIYCLVSGPHSGPLTSHRSSNTEAGRHSTTTLNNEGGQYQSP